MHSVQGSPATERFVANFAGLQIRTRVADKRVPFPDHDEGQVC